MVQKTKKNQAKASAPSIAFRLRHIEHTLSLSIALLTALTTVLIHPFSLLAWSAVGIALLVSFWSHTYPAKTYASMVTRSLVLLFMAVLLHTDTQLGGAHGTYFYWTLATDYCGFINFL